MIHSKYIIFDDGDKGLPVVFSPLLQHNHVADRKPVISAGYCDVRVKTEGDKKLPNGMCGVNPFRFANHAVRLKTKKS